MYNERSKVPVLLINKNQFDNILKHYMDITLKDVEDKELLESKDNKLEYIELRINRITNENIDFEINANFKYTKLTINFLESKNRPSSEVDFESIINKAR